MISEKVRFINADESIATFACPGCGNMHYVNVLNDFMYNGDSEYPSFTPSVLTQTGKYADPDYYNSLPPGDEKDLLDQTSIKCLCTVTNGEASFDASSTHGYAGQTGYLPEIAPQGEELLMPLATPVV